jgi:hypothetical protein
LISMSSISLFVRLLFCGSPKPARVVELLLVLSRFVVGGLILDFVGVDLEGVYDGSVTSGVTCLSLTFALPGFV